MKGATKVVRQDTLPTGTIIVSVVNPLYLCGKSTNVGFFGNNTPMGVAKKMGCVYPNKGGIS